MKYAWLLLTVPLVGCSPDNLAVDIGHFVATTQATLCVADPASTLLQASGTLDVGIVNAGASSGYRGYFVAPLVRNEIPERANQPPGAIELDAIYLTGFDVRLEGDPSIAGAIPAQARSFSLKVGDVRLAPASTGATLFVEVIPVSVAQALSKVVSGTQLPLMIVHLRPVADHGGSVITGRWADFPVSICNFCLTGGPPPTCGTLPMMPSQVHATSCNPSQDAPVTCCKAGTQLLCGKQLLPVM